MGSDCGDDFRRLIQLQAVELGKKIAYVDLVDALSCFKQVTGQLSLAAPRRSDYHQEAARSEYIGGLQQSRHVPPFVAQCHVHLINKSQAAFNTLAAISRIN